MIVNLIKRPDGLFEIETEGDGDKLAKLAFGEIVEVSLKKVRDPLNHRRYFVMHKIYFDNQLDYKDEHVCRKSVEMEAGYYDFVYLFWNDEKIQRRWPKSISYATLDETEFIPLKQKCGDVICERLGLDEGELQEEIIKLAYINTSRNQ